MENFRKFPTSHTRQLINYNRFVSLTGNKVFICLDKGILEIARYLLNTRGSWRTTYVKEYVGMIGYNMPTEAEFELVTQAIAEANIDMASCDEIVEAINGVRFAIETGSVTSGGDCGCIASGADDITSVLDTPPVDEPDREGPPPDGYSTWEEFDEAKCNMVVAYLEKFIGTLRNWGGFSGLVGGLTIAVIVGVTLLTIPPVGLTLLLAALAAIFTINIANFAFFTDMADYIDSVIDDVKCDLYEASGSGDAQTIMQGYIDDAIADLVGASAVASYLSAAANTLLYNSGIAGIYDGTFDTDGITGDCSECGPSGAFLIELFDPLEVGDTGTLEKVGNHYTLTSASNAGRQAVNIHAVDPTDPEQPRCFIITNIVSSASHEFYNDNVYPCGDGEFTEFPSGDVEIDGQDDCIHGLILQGDPGDPFVVEFDAIDPCEPPP